MNNKFVCDVGDFGKFGLLRALAGQKLSLAVAWYYTAGARTGGSLRGYLQPVAASGYAAADAGLYRALQALDAVGDSAKTVQGLEGAEILPPGTQYFRDEIPKRLAHNRLDWRNRMHAAVRSADVVFCDPDNGLAPDSWVMKPEKADRYMFVSEAHALWSTGASLVIYHHEGSNQLGNPQRLERDLELHRSALTALAPAQAVIWGEGSRRAYLVVAQPAHRERVGKALATVTSGPWQRFFTKA